MRDRNRSGVVSATTITGPCQLPSKILDVVATESRPGRDPSGSQPAGASSALAGPQRAPRAANSIFSMCPVCAPAAHREIETACARHGDCTAGSSGASRPQSACRVPARALAPMPQVGAGSRPAVSRVVRRWPRHGGRWRSPGLSSAEQHLESFLQHGHEASGKGAAQVYEERISALPRMRRPAARDVSSALRSSDGLARGRRCTTGCAGRP